MMHVASNDEENDDNDFEYGSDDDEAEDEVQKLDKSHAYKCLKGSFLNTMQSHLVLSYFQLASVPALANECMPKKGSNVFLPRW